MPRQSRSCAVKRTGCHKEGFTLIELMVVLIILSLLAALVGPRLFSKVGKGKQVAAASQIKIFGQALDQYKLDTGDYPTTEQGLSALQANPGGIQGWDGPYLKKGIPKDPWGRPYNYQCPGQHGDYDLYSYGKDGVPGGTGESKEVDSWENSGS
ncbi:MAG: type II secretion system major pseudopilin GspG [Actinomycetota bacterium]|nr:type II secretion system major pseudopilin GspG [Actinomycetota bacterium]